MLLIVRKRQKLQKKLEKVTSQCAPKAWWETLFPRQREQSVAGEGEGPRGGWAPAGRVVGSVFRITGVACSRSPPTLAGQGRREEDADPSRWVGGGFHEQENFRTELALATR